jgi:hypothetical protein
MASTYSTNLKIELMANGENAGTWGNVTNTNLGTALEQAIVGYGNPSYASDANLSISLTNTNAAQAARALVLNVTSSVSLTATRELIVPTIEKQYIVQNNTTGSQSITVKTSAGTGITVPNGRKAHLYVDGTNVIQMFDFVDINGGTIDGASVGASSPSTGAFTTLTASGATTLNGTVALGDASGDLITVPGTVNSNLLFTDNTYDIGASGATRPRNLYLAGDAVIGGSMSLSTLDLTNLEVTNIKAKDGTAAASIADSTGAITVSSILNVDNLRLDTNTISSTNSNGAINLTPNGTGQVTITNDASINNVFVGKSGSSGSGNTRVGAGALAALTTGDSNTAIGSTALANATTIASTTAVGLSAGALINGDRNTAIGASALRGSVTVANNTGNDNVAIGVLALPQNNTGSYNVVVGNSAMYSSAAVSGNSPSYNTVIGYAAGYFILPTSTTNTARDNTLVGYNAGFSSTSGSYNTALGSEAFYNNTTGSSSTAIGYRSLYNMRGSSNVGIGWSAIKGSATPANNTGEDNVAVGTAALQSLTSGSYNVALGSLTLATASSGQFNVGIGVSALSSLTTATGNVALGASALFYNQTGDYQIAIGNGAGLNIRGSYNTAIGYQALYASTSPSSNTGAYNVAIGYRSAYSTTSGSNNVLIGYWSGYSITTGSNNTFIGPLNGFDASGSTVTTGNYNTIVGGFNGNSGGLDIRTSSNRIVLSDGQGNPRWYTDNTGATGYAPSNGGTVTQGTSRTTGVTLNKPTGAITLVSAAGTTAWQSFTVTNNTVTALDTVIVNQKSGTDLYQIFVTNVAAGSFQITFATTGGTTTEQPVFNFTVIKGQTS